uniref:Uncharacterized protein n=1 Tax=uncultured alpha proteobacterium EF100_102A06 TaxID=710799 RepID=E0Y2C9_9PROT|nr:hypothetical protein [uncultured alpha proteobacterium EF100_102A06]
MSRLLLQLSRLSENKVTLRYAFAVSQKTRRTLRRASNYCLHHCILLFLAEIEATTMRTPARALVQNHRDLVSGLGTASP